MGKNFVQEGCSIMIAIPAGGCSTGTPIKVGGDLVGVPDGNYDAGASGNVTLHLEGVFSGLAKKANDTFAVGDVVYWDNGGSYFTSTSSGNLKKGHCMVTAAAADTTMTVRILQ